MQGLMWPVLAIALAIAILAAPAALSGVRFDKALGGAVALYLVVGALLASLQALSSGSCEDWRRRGTTAHAATRWLMNAALWPADTARLVAEDRAISRLWAPRRCAATALSPEAVDALRDLTGN